MMRQTHFSSPSTVLSRTLLPPYCAAHPNSRHPTQEAGGVVTVPVFTFLAYPYTASHARACVDVRHVDDAMCTIEGFPSLYEGFTGCPKPPSENPPAGPGEGYDGPPIPPSAHWEEHPLAADDNDNSSASEAKISEVVADAVGADGEEGGRSLDTPAQAQQPTAAARGGGDVGGGGGGGGGGVKLNSKESSPHYGGLCKVLLLKAARQLIEQRSARATPSATTAAKGGAAGSKPAKTKASTLQTSMSPINETATSASSPTQQKAGGEAAEAGPYE